MAIITLNWQLLTFLMVLTSYHLTNPSTHPVKNILLQNSTLSTEFVWRSVRAWQAPVVQFDKQAYPSTLPVRTKLSLKSMHQDNSTGPDANNQRQKNARSVPILLTPSIDPGLLGHQQIVFILIFLKLARFTQTILNLLQLIIKQTIMNPKFTRKQIVDATLKEYEANAAYLTQQSIDQLRVIKNSMKIEARKQTDQVKKFEMEEIANQADDEVIFRTTKDSQKLQNLNVVRQIKQSRKVISTQAIIAAIVSPLQGLFIYFQSDQRDDWFTTTAKILIFVFIVLFFVVLGYNYLCKRKIQKGEYQQLQQTEEDLTKRRKEESDEFINIINLKNKDSLLINRQHQMERNSIS